MKRLSQFSFVHKMEKKEKKIRIFVINRPDIYSKKLESMLLVIFQLSEKYTNRIRTNYVLALSCQCSVNLAHEAIVQKSMLSSTAELSQTNLENRNPPANHIDPNKWSDMEFSSTE